MSVTGQRKPTDQGKSHIPGCEDGAAPLQRNLMRATGIIESGTALQAEAHAAADGSDDTHNLMGFAPGWRILDGHKIEHLAHPVGAEEPRQQDAALGQIHLFMLRVVERGDLEEAALAVVENTGKNAR